MYQSLKSTIGLLLISSIFVSCATTHEDSVNSKMSGTQKEKKERQNEERLRNLSDRYSRLDRYDR